jgi:uncharacterized cupin superfamily protein
VVQQDDIEWEQESTSDGEPLFTRRRLSAAAGGRKLGCSLCRLPPRSRSWPRHYHLANEEAIYVLSGSGSLWVGDDVVPLAPGDYAALTVGAERAHKVVNDGDSELVFLAISTMIHPDVVIYPDSGKVGVFGGVAPGGPVEERTLKAFLPLAAEVDYWKGE